MSDEKIEKLAVLIDADNAQPSIADGLLSEIAKYGTANVKRIYGDWTLKGNLFKRQKKEIGSKTSNNADEADVKKRLGLP